MTSSPLFAVANDETLSRAIRNSQKTLVYVAPGITQAIVEALQKQLNTQPNLQLTLIIDLDPEVYRLGYGTEEGLRALQTLAKDYQLDIRRQEGLRLGLLISDGQTLLYAPTPLLIEAGSESQTKPNALLIEPHTQLVKKLMYACGASGSSNDNTPPPNAAEIGQQAADVKAVEQSLQSLVNTPPKKFDVARVERVFESKIQFVELELTGYRLSIKSINIPNDLLVGEDKTLKDRLKNSFKLLDKAKTLEVLIPEFDENGQEMFDSDGNVLTEPWSEKELEQQRKSLYEDFLTNVPSFGQIIMRHKRVEFDARIVKLKRQIEAFKLVMIEKIQTLMNHAITELANTLLPRIKHKLPTRYTKFKSHYTDKELLYKISEDLHKSCGGVAGLFNPELSCVFKDVTYESINDKKFQQSLTQAMRKEGCEDIVRELFNEYDAAPESDQFDLFG